jgi:phosphoribosyl 1,2-cyclic phosphodiesterase
MEILFWGTRGSLPYAVTSNIVKEKIKTAIELARGRTFNSSEELDLFIENALPFSIRGGYGCNTSCIEIKGGNEFILCDAGTGLRDFGNSVMASLGKKENPKVINIFLSHLHWDHIQGFPFFTPAYIPGYTINIFGFHEGIKDVFVKQQAAPCFPVPLQAMQAKINFTTLDLKDEYSIADFKIKGIKQNHPGDSYGYSFEKNDKKAVYSTDNEHKKDAEQEDYKFIEFCKNADLLILDAQYSLIDAIHTKKDWGHSSNILVTELAVRSKVKRLCMFHHEPTCNDDDLENFLKDTIDYLKIYDESSPLRIEMSYDSMHIKL